MVLQKFEFPEHGFHQARSRRVTFEAYSVPGDPIVWPGILPMWFHYKNPVSGRVPEHYWPDCVPCAQYPETSMKNHGYLLPPN